jgi:hypothetical protein
MIREERWKIPKSSARKIRMMTTNPTHCEIVMGAGAGMAGA